MPRTACQAQQVELFPDGGKPVVLSFDGGEITSNAGAVLLRLLDEKFHIAERMASVWTDRRDQRYVKHELVDLIRQRLYQIACGYEDANDADSLRYDAAFVVSCAQTDREEPLASQPTLSRLENQVDTKTLYRLSELLVELFFQVFDEPPEEIVLDVDATDATTYGGQQLTFFNGYYDEYIYHPLLIYEGNTGFPLAAVLRGGNQHAGYKAAAILRRLVRRIRQRWPGVRIVLRADSGFARPEMLNMLEEEGVEYYIGLIRNRRLEREVQAALHELRERRQRRGKSRRKFTSFWFAARSWPKRRRVIARLDITLDKDNPRFVVTNARRGRARECYQFYCGRAVGAEAPMKELKNTFSGHRLSCHRFLANQLRLLLSTLAFVLVWLVRRASRSVEWLHRRLDTIRTRFLKIGASVRRCVRHIRFRLPTALPDKEDFVRILLAAQPPTWQLRLY